MRECVSIVLSPQHVVLCYRSPRTLGSPMHQWWWEFNSGQTRLPFCVTLQMPLYTLPFCVLKADSVEPPPSDFWLGWALRSGCGVGGVHIAESLPWDAASLQPSLPPSTCWEMPLLINCPQRS